MSWSFLHRSVVRNTVIRLTVRLRLGVREIVDTRLLLVQRGMGAREQAARGVRPADLSARATQGEKKEGDERIGNLGYQNDQ